MVLVPVLVHRKLIFESHFVISKPYIYIFKCDLVYIHYFRSCFANQGEICLCTERMFVQKEIFSEFVKRFVAQTRFVHSISVP